MRKTRISMKKCLSAAALVLAMAGMMLCAVTTTSAADIAKTRGRVNIDLEDFVLVESTISDTNDFGLKSQNDANSRYKFHFSNSFTNRNNIGCTYRSSQKYDMTDVTAIEMYAYSQQDADDKILFYVDPGSKTYYHRKNFDEVTTNLVSGDGTVKPLSYFCYLAYGTTPQDYKFGITQRYGNEYVYLGLSHSWWSSNAILYIDNKTITSTTEGCINLYLKKHNITLLQPEPFTLVNADGEEVESAVYANLSLGLEDGEYEVNETGSVYRDESITFKYTLESAEMCDLVSYKLYSDKNKENLLYTIDVSKSSNKSTIVFDSTLIKKLEEKTGSYQLGDIYIEPIFYAKEVAFDFNSIVTEHSGLEVVSTDTSGNTYELREKESKAVIGRFAKNAAGKIGDTLTLDYAPNENYTGAYAFSYYEIRICEAQNQVDTTSWAVAYYSEEKHDIEKKYNDTYFWVRAHIKKAVNVKLEDITTEYANKHVSIGKATATWQGTPVNVDENDIIYEYYTDVSCDENYLMTELPINAGAYYVKATLKSGDEWDATESNIAMLTINKAVPILSEVEAEAITYGETLAESVEITGVAKGVGNTTVTGSFEWVDNTLILNAGNQSAEVRFVPNELYAKNYIGAIGYASIYVNQAIPDIKLSDKTAVFAGEPIPMDTATVTGIDGKATGQKITYEYYPSEACNKSERSLDAPTNVGTYYVLASAASGGNYGYVKTKVPAKLEIIPYKTELLQAPVGEVVDQNSDGNITKNEYRVYVKNRMATNPKGTITLEFIVNGETKGWAKGLTINEEGYAVYYHDNVSQYMEDATEAIVKATYIPVENDNYSIKENSLTVYMADGELRASKQVSTWTTYGSDSFFLLRMSIFPDGRVPEGTVFTWYNLESDVLIMEPVGNTGEVKMTTMGVGTAVVRAYVNVPDDGENAQDFYVSITVEVKKGNRGVVATERIGNMFLTQIEFTYNGMPQMYEYVTKEFYPETQTWDYVPAVGETCIVRKQKTGEYYESGAVDVGRYNVEVTVPETELYNETTTYSTEGGLVTLVINPTTPTVTLKDKTVTYDGSPKAIDEAVLAGVSGGTAVTGNVSYSYKGINGTEYESSEAPTNAGTYEVIATVTADGNYTAATSNPAVLTIMQTTCTVEVEEKTVSYTGQPVSIEATVKNVSGVVMDSVQIMVYYQDYMTGETSTEAPVDAGFYYVWAETVGDKNCSAAISSRVILTITPADIEVTFDVGSYTYTGEVVDLTMENTSTKVISDLGADLTGQTDVEYSFYQSEEGTVRIDAPVNAGTYYVQAATKAQTNYNGGKSELVKMTIEKAVPEITVSAGNIVYGQEISESEITGTATGVKGETLEGLFTITGDIRHQTPDAGTYEVEIIFDPAGEDSYNYVSGTAEASLIVEKYQTVLVGSDKTEDNKAVQTSDSNHLIWYVILCIASSVIIMVERKYRRR